MRLKRQLIGVVLTGLAFVTMSGAKADRGAVIAGHPVTSLRAITESEFRYVNGCGSLPTRTQGVDALVIDLGGHTYLDLDSSSVAPYNLNFIFYAAGDCFTNSAYNSIGTSRSSWHNYIPAGMRFLVVSPQFGGNVNINWSVRTPI